MTTARQVYLSIVLLTTARAGSCGNECDFFERCEGNVLQTCGGVDQFFNRKVEERPCVAPNPACVVVNSSARCVTSQTPDCTESFVPHCEGSLLLACSFLPPGFVVAEDCAAAAGRRCGVDGSGRAACVPAP